MEIALELARHRAGRGAPAAGDRGPLARAALDPERSPPSPPCRRGRSGRAGGASTRSPAALAARGLAVTVADLPAPADGLAVAKAFAPGLRPLPGGAAGAAGEPRGRRAADVM